MATIEEGSLCIVDANCSAEQYCYEVSGQCVDYTLCSRHNRAENVVRSRHPSHCGDCLPGYTAEVLGTGEKALLCQKISMQEDSAEPAKLSNAVIVWIVIGALFVVMTATAGFFLRKRICALREKKKSKQWTELCIIGPSAPPAENSPFIGIGDRITCESFNNNQNLKDKNRLVSATPYKEPNWVRTNPNYERNLSNEELNVSGQLQTMAQLPPSDNNSNSWIPGQMTIQVTSASLNNHATEERDNSLNTALVQGSRPSTSSGTGNNRTNSNNNNNNNSHGSTSNSNYSEGSRERLTANVLITQKISTNVNVVNAD